MIIIFMGRLKFIVIIVIIMAVGIFVSILVIKLAMIGCLSTSLIYYLSHLLSTTATTDCLLSSDYLIAIWRATKRAYLYCSCLTQRHVCSSTHSSVMSHGTLSPTQASHYSCMVSDHI